MTKCINCANAVWDYEEYYNTTKRQYFVSGCKLDMDESDDCEEYIDADMQEGE